MITVVLITIFRFAVTEKLRGLQKKILTYAFLLWVLFAYCQDDTFYHYGIDDGLSQESVQTILKSKDGFLWLGTQDGLNRFDGKKFKIYKHDIFDGNSISGNFIVKLLENKGKIWIGTSNNGVSIYDEKLDTFNSIGSKTAYCTAIEKDKKGNVYVAYLKEGLFVFTSKNDSIKKKSIPFFKDNFLTITSLRTDNKNNLFVGTKTGRLFKANLNNDFLNFSEISFSRTIGSIKYLFFENDRFWLGTSNGVFFVEENILKLLNLGDSPQNLVIYAIKKKDNNYFFATDNGLYKCSNLDESQQKFQQVIHYIGDNNELNSITSNRVYDIHFDENLLWIGTNKLDLLSLEENVFKGINTKSIPAIDNNHIYAILKTDSYLFIGTRKGLNCIDNYGNTTVITKENTNQKLAYNVIRNIVKRGNQLWLSTTKGISIIKLIDFNPNKPKITSFYSDINDPTSLTNNNTRQIFVDHQNNIWISTYGGGLDLFTGDISNHQFTFKHFKHLKNKNSISSNFVFNVSQDIDNNYWIATKSGLSKMKYNFKNGKVLFTVFKREDGNAQKLQSNNILSTFHDSNDDVWVGTSNGLYRLDQNKNIFKSFGVKEGLTNGVIYSILEDKNNDLWVSTNSGIFQYNKKQSKFINYTLQDGLHSTEYNLGAQFKNKKNNLLYFGGTNGIDYFNPDTIINLYQEGNLKLTSLNIKGGNIKPVENGSILTKSITNANKINLNYNDFPLYLTFSDLNFKPYKNSTFYYKLLPNSDDWNLIKKGNEIQFLNLSPGNYTLQLQGKSHQKFWSKKPLEVMLLVNPPWFKSNFAYLIYLATFLILIYFIVNHFIKRNLEYKELERLKEIDELKTILYTNITHEFRTPITIILGMAQNIKEKQANKVNIQKQLALIEKNSNSLLNLVNQILNLSKLDKGKLNLNLVQNDIVNYIKYLTESFSSYAEENDVLLVFYSDEESILMDYDLDKIEQIISNLISNAVKFCDKKGKIIVHLSKESSNLIIKVKDTGIGIKEENLALIFDRFYQIKNTNTRNYDGTGIGLALVKELIILMNGTIEVKSKVGFGTAFTIMLPIIKNEKLVIIKNKKLKIRPIISSNSVKERKNINNDTSLPIVLVVEDNSDVAEYVFSCLDNKYQIIYAENGKIGIEKAMRYIPDVIISDVMMPKTDGIEMCKIIKGDIKTNHIPIILLTAKSTQQDKITGLKTGADAYLTKPFQKDELLIRLEKLIDLRKILLQKYNNVDGLVLKNEEEISLIENLNDKFVQKIIEIVHQNIDNSDLKAIHIANSLSMSESQLYRKLKSISNNSVSIFVRKIRLSKAKEMLQSNDYTISEISYMTGFNSPSWFSKCFKDEFGYSPSHKK